MASHGVTRVSATTDKSQDARDKELKDIKVYQDLVEFVNSKVRERERRRKLILTFVLIAEGDFSPEVLQKTAELLKRNPEYYTIWNHRRRIYAAEFRNLQAAVDSGELREEDRTSQILQIIELDLQFLVPLLIKFPKCYWIWNHRLWLLEQASLLFHAETSRPLWKDELGLVGKMLGRDSRNFMGWGYRRIVIQNLESPTLNGSSMARKEFDYTTKMIGTNLSNFSAWHNRTKLILRFLDEGSATDDERRSTLDEELKLIHKALFDPYDQSLWFYHQNLMCTFDPSTALQSMAPNLSNKARLEYLSQEREFIEEILEDATDCKWVYQALIECYQLRGKLEGRLTAESSAEALVWLAELMKLDPLRRGRWQDLERSLRKRD